MIYLVLFCFSCLETSTQGKRMVLNNSDPSRRQEEVSFFFLDFGDLVCDFCLGVWSGGEEVCS